MAKRKEAWDPLGDLIRNSKKVVLDNEDDDLLDEEDEEDDEENHVIEIDPPHKLPEPFGDWSILLVLENDDGEIEEIVMIDEEGTERVYALI